MARLKGSTEWTPIYMLIVFVIAAILVITLVKPLMRNAGSVASENLQQARTLAQNAWWLWFR